MTARKLTQAEIAEQLRGSTRLAPGIWEDQHGDLHFSVPELLAAFGWDDTPKHRAIVTRTIREMLARTCPDATIIDQE